MGEVTSLEHRRVSRGDSSVILQQDWEISDSVAKTNHCLHVVSSMYRIPVSFHAAA